MIGVMSYSAFFICSMRNVFCYFCQKQSIGDHVDRMIAQSSEIAAQVGITKGEKFAINRKESQCQT